MRPDTRSSNSKTSPSKAAAVQPFSRETCIVCTTLPDPDELRPYPGIATRICRPALNPSDVAGCRESECPAVSIGASSQQVHTRGCGGLPSSGESHAHRPRTLKSACFSWSDPYPRRLNPFRLPGRLRGVILSPTMLTDISGAREHQPCGGLPGEYSPVFRTEPEGPSRCRGRSGVAGSFLDELHPGGEAKLRVDVGEVELHSRTTSRPAR